MRWTRKAAIQRTLARLPRGDALYRRMQRRFGNLRPDPFLRLPKVAEMVQTMDHLGGRVEGSRCLEVGTGHVPRVPVGLYLAGAVEVVTVDLYRRLDWPLTAAMLRLTAQHAHRVEELFAGLVDRAALANRLVRLEAAVDVDPEKALEDLGISYRAPADAAALSDGDESFDFHVSVTTLEHIPPPDIERILREARRVLRPNAIAAHFVDLSDHFAHGDSSLPLINFLRYSDREWQRIAGNRFSYMNRLRAGEILGLFEQAGFSIIRADRHVDPGSVAALQANFPLAERFRAWAAEELSTTSIRIYAQAGGTMLASQ